MSTFTVVFSLLLTSLFSSIYCQTVVDGSHCVPSCPAQGEASYKIYCCSDNNFRNPTVSYACCNPYIDLYIGLGIGVPIVIALITAAIILYCCWWNHNRKKRQRLMQLYLASRVIQSSASDSVAPPPYTPAGDNELPRYTEDDPYSSLKEREEERDKELEEATGASTGTEPLL